MRLVPVKMSPNTQIVMFVGEKERAATTISKAHIIGAEYDDTQKIREFILSGFPVTRDLESFELKLGVLSKDLLLSKESNVHCSFPCSSTNEDHLRPTSILKMNLKV